MLGRVKPICILIVVLGQLNCDAQMQLSENDLFQLNLHLDRIDSSQADSITYSKLDSFIQDHELNGLEARVMCEKLFNSKAFPSYDLLIKYNLKFTRPAMKNSAIIINGEVCIIHAEITRLGVVKIKSFADYIYSSKLDKPLNKESLYFFRLILLHYAEYYYIKYHNEKNISMSKKSNLREIFKHFEIQE